MEELKQFQQRVDMEAEAKVELAATLRHDAVKFAQQELQESRAEASAYRALYRLVGIGGHTSSINWHELDLVIANLVRRGSGQGARERERERQIF